MNENNLVGNLKFVDAVAVRKSTPMLELIAVLDDTFRQPPFAPNRHHDAIEPYEGDPEGTLLLMPAWRPGVSVGVKVVTVFPGASALDRPAIQGTYILSDGRTGEIKAIIDGKALTTRRTAAASALAAKYLARDDAKTLLVVGTGSMAPHLIEAHCSVRDIKTVLIWGRRAQKAELVAAEFEGSPFAIEVVTDLERAARRADVISCATLSTEPIILGSWLQPGVHVDLVGGFKPNMRETDNEAIQRARVYVDTFEGALSEAGDLLIPIAEGDFATGEIIAELSDLASGANPGRENDLEITLFKSVGASIEDLAAAELVLRSTE